MFVGRLDADRLRALFTHAMPVTGMDHVWLGGPRRKLDAAREVLAEFDKPAQNVHFELFYVDAPPRSRLLNRPILEEGMMATTPTSESAALTPGGLAVRKVLGDL